MSAWFATSPITVSYPTTSSSAVSNVAFTTTSPEAGATQVTDQFRFTAGHAATDTYTITLTAPSGTVFPAQGDNDYLVENLTTVQTGGGGLNYFTIDGAGTNQVVINDVIPYESGGPYFNPGDQVLVTVNGLTNPTSAETGQFELSTSSDPTPAAVTDKTTAATAVSNIAFTTSSSEAGATDVTDLIRFTAGRAVNGPYTITLTAPSVPSFRPRGTTTTTTSSRT